MLSLGLSLRPLNYTLPVYYIFNQLAPHHIQHKCNAMCDQIYSLVRYLFYSTSITTSSQIRAMYCFVSNTLKAAQTVSTLVLQPGKTHGLLPEIQAHILSTYFKEQNWTFNQENPSKLKIIQETGGHARLTDRFMEKSTWILAVEKPKNNSQTNIAGAMRLIENEPIELAGYRSKPIHDILDKYGATGLVETNRLAVNSNYRDRGVGGKLMKALFQYLAEKENDDRPLVASIPLNCLYGTNSSLLSEVLMPVGKPFYYEETDPAPAQLFISHRPDLQKAVSFFMKNRTEHNFQCKTNEIEST